MQKRRNSGEMFAELFKDTATFEHYEPVQNNNVLYELNDYLTKNKAPEVISLDEEENVLEGDDFGNVDFVKVLDKQIDLEIPKFLKADSEKESEVASEHNEDMSKLDHLTNPFANNYDANNGVQQLSEILKIKQQSVAKCEDDNLTQDGIKEDATVNGHPEPIEQNEEVKEEVLPEPTPSAPKEAKKRKDVVFKTILRKCRKYYQTVFNLKAGFLKSRKSQPCSYYRECIQKFIDQVVTIKCNHDLSFHMGALLYPQEMVRWIETFIYPEGVKTFTPKKVVKRKVESHKLQVDKLHNILYKYTHEKMKKFISIPELSVIFLNFLEKYMQDPKEWGPDEKEQLKELVKQCKKSLKGRKKNKHSFTMLA